ncbi:chorismate mutase [Streptomyces sp. NPDC020141]|uniref:chorismate mutase n=1 Tax=Streptomyces sp. NPDC020141 TaxID=3365065 RepID=UPI0037A89A5D
MALTAGLLVITAMVAALVLSCTSGEPRASRERPPGPPGPPVGRRVDRAVLAGFLTGGGAVATRAIRGATQADGNDRESILEATAELLAEVMHRNALTVDDVISVLFTATPDLTAEFPALAARTSGLHDVPLLCAVEIDVPGAPPRVVRLLVHADTGRPRAQIQHVYLRGAPEPREDPAGARRAEGPGA